jgi:hypothetical protein
MTDPRLSQHPVDILIRRIIGGERSAKQGEIEQIIERIGSAPFDDRLFRVPQELLADTALNLSLGERESSLVIHHARRLREEQWAPATTVAEYLSDLRASVRSADARLALYFRRGGHMAASIGSTELVIPKGHRGAGAAASVLVVFSADRGALVSGYQFSDLSTVAIPGDALWLK